MLSTAQVENKKVPPPLHRSGLPSPDIDIEALEEAIERYGVPEIFNTDQGSQFTCSAFTDVLDKHGVKISMDGKGRALDNVFVERLWMTVKYENVYRRDYGSVAECRDGLAWKKSKVKIL